MKRFWTVTGVLLAALYITVGCLFLFSMGGCTVTPQDLEDCRKLCIVFNLQLSTVEPPRNCICSGQRASRNFSVYQVN